MKLTIDIDENQLTHYEELMNERVDLLKEMHERLSKYKQNIKKAEKDLIYKEKSYNFVIAGVEANDIKDKLFVKVLEEWKKKKLPKNT